LGGDAVANEAWIGAAITRSGAATEVFAWRWETNPDSGASVDI
jgi:hypothetical protein